MEQENLEFLQRNALFYKGFGKDLYDKLQENMTNGLDKFTLEKPIRFEKLNEAGYDYKLDFKHSNKDEQDRYFLNKIIATSKDDPAKTFGFYVTPSDGIPAKVAANFLEGKPIFRTGKDDAGITYANWHLLKKNDAGKYEEQIYYKNHGYEPVSALTKMPYGREVTAEQLSAYERSLKRGDDLSLMLEIGGEKEKFSLAANLDSRTVDVFNKEGNLVLQQPALSEAVRQKMEQAEQKEQATQVGQKASPESQPQQKQPAAKMKAAVTPKQGATAKQGVARKPPRKTTPVQGAAKTKGKRR